MYYFEIILKLIVGLSIINVWTLQRNKATKWRGGNATTIVEEFKAYGLSKDMCIIVGVLKVALSIGLLASIHFQSVENICAIGLALLLTGSIAMHLKIKDPLYKSFPAALFLLCNILIVVL